MIVSATNLIERHSRALSEVRRYLHRYPEISGQEYETTRFLANELSKSSIPYRLGPDSRGLIVDLGNPEADQILAIRADIDAIVAQDVKNVDYRSQVENVMHGCGHDAHSSILLGTVRALHDVLVDQHSQHAVRAIFQPEEEVATGASTLIETGVLDGVSFIVAGHVDPTRDIGKIGLRSGVNTAHCNEISVDIHGRGGHAARPHETIDPIELGSQFVSDCYSAIPRYTEAAKKVVLSFTAFQGGDSFNVIPDHVRLSGTMRSLDKDARENAIAAIKQVATTLSAAKGAQIEVHFGLEVPSIVTDTSVTEYVRTMGIELLGQANVETIAEPSMGGEDFAFYSHRVPASFVRIGSRGELIGSLPLHNSAFDIDERALRIGVNLFTNLALRFLFEESCETAAN